MSLGITALRRAWPQLGLGPLIPREPLLVLRPPSIHPSDAKFFFSTRARLYHSDTGHAPESFGSAIIRSERPRADAEELGDVPLARRPEVVGNTDEARDLEDLLSQAPKKTLMREEGSKTELQKLEESLERSQLAGSVLVNPARTTLHKKETRASARAHHKIIMNQVKLNRKLQKGLDEGSFINPHSADWRRILSLLARRTPEESVEWIEDGMKIELPEKALAAIMNNGGDEKIGSIRRRTGACIKVSRAETPSGASTLLVSGTRQAINRATTEFGRIARRITITRLWAPLDPGEKRTESLSKDDGDFFVPPLTREEGGLWHRFKVDYQAHTTPWPQKLSHSSFFQYVASLTDSVMLPHLNSILYNPTKHALLLDHERAVVRRLKSAFTNEEARPWISCSAFKLALFFLCRKGDKYLPEARSIFLKMDEYALRMDADVFNILLKAPTKTCDLRKFRQTLFLMVNRGLAPNLDTWILFLRMFESVQVKSYILHVMRTKNLLGTPESIQRVAEEMAAFDAEHAVAVGKDLPTFMQEQSVRYGPDWLTRDAINPVLNVLCRHGRFHDAFKLLSHMGAHADSIPDGFKADQVAARPDVVSFNTIISHAKSQGKMTVAVNAVRKMRTAVLRTQPDCITFGLLFEMAWRMRLRYTLSVIWKYASLARLTSWRMRQRVTALLSVALDGGEWAMKHGVSASTYAQLGGERLARDLVGGEQALAKIRSLAEGHARAELGVMATKVWPKAFSEFGPTVTLGHVLAQAVLRDRFCIRVTRQNHAFATEELSKLRPNELPLRERVAENELGCGDLAPLPDEGPEPIGPDDMWNLDETLEHGHKKLEMLRISSDSSPCSEPQVHLGPTMPRECPSILIFEPEVWATAEGQGDGAKLQPRYQLQSDNEKKILAALGGLK